MAAYNKFQPAVENLVEGINSGTDTWAIKLGTAVNASAGTFTESTSGTGYTTGGTAVTITSSAATAGVYKLVLTSPATWTASGAGFSFQYAILANTTAGVNVGYWDYGAAQTVAAGETVTVTLDATNGVFQVT